MHNPHNLQHAEPAKRDQRNALIALLAPHRNRLRHKQRRVAQQAESKQERNELPHRIDLPATNQSPNRSAPRALAFAGSSSRFFGGAFVSSASSRRLDTAATSSIAARNAASLGFEGFVNPQILRTKCSEAARTSSSVTGGSKLNKFLMLRHITMSSSHSGFQSCLIGLKFTVAGVCNDDCRGRNGYASSKSRENDRTRRSASYSNREGAGGLHPGALRIDCTTASDEGPGRCH